MKEVHADKTTDKAFHHFKENYKDRFCLELNHANGNITSIEYNHLAMVCFEKGSVTVHYIHTLVKITGQNLENLALAIGRREAGEITEKHTPAKLAQGEAYIDRIEIKDR